MNKTRWNDVELVAVSKSDRPTSCVGCFFDINKICPRGVKSDLAPHCAASMRNDGRDVIFVEEIK